MFKRPNKMTPRRRLIRRVGKKLLWSLIVVSAAGGMVLADRSGVFGQKPLPDLDKYDGKSFLVVRVVDGDTLDVHVPDGDNSSTRIRLWGVDTPETKKPDTPVQHFGTEAAEFTGRSCEGKTVRLGLLARDTRDKYGRLLAYVYLPDGRMLNRILVEDGFAYADPRFDHQHRRDFTRAQNRARKARRGLWKSVTNADLPWYYRHKLRLPTE